jgi:hypothetical protein
VSKVGGGVKGGGVDMVRITNWIRNRWVKIDP